MIREAGRYNVVACGRRWGKSILGVNLACETALAGYPAGWFAPEYRLLREAWRELKAALAPIARFNEAERRIDLETGGFIECWAFDRNPNAGRSRRYKRAVVDEAAHCRDLESIWAKAIRATLTDFKGDAWFLSSPNGKNGFARLFERGRRRDGKWRAWQMSTYTNPFIDPSEVDEAKLDLDEWAFRQEYLAEFLDENDGALIPASWVDRCAAASFILEAALRRSKGEGGRRRLAVDLSLGGGKGDRTVIPVRDRLGTLRWHESPYTGLSEAATWVARYAREFGVEDNDIVYDAGGPGRDFPRYLEQHGIGGAVPYHGGAPSRGRYANRRARTYWRLRQRLDPDRPPERVPEPEPSESIWAPPPKPAVLRLQPPFAIDIGGSFAGLAEELKAVRYSLVGGKIVLEKKDDLVARLGRSPDAADALAMTYHLDAED